MTLIQCDECLGNKFHLTVEADDAICVECSKIFPSNSTISQEILDELEASEDVLNKCLNEKCGL